MLKQVCPHGHVDQYRRYGARNAQRCFACHILRETARGKANPEKRRDRSAAYRQKYPDRMQACRDAWAAENKERIRETRKIRDRRNKEHIRARNAAWLQANLGKHAAHQAQRRAMKMRQRCGCCTDDMIAEPFLTAALFSGHVDHKILLALGGHHCTKNLQALTAENHIEKTKADMKQIAGARLRNRLLKVWRA